MKSKKFLVQIESAPDTRWLVDGKLLTDLLTLAVARTVQANTRGTVPRVTVIEDERRGQ